MDSVLAQTDSRFEYILSDNCSSDGSGQIAEAYACRDPRIRLIRQTQLLSQVEHYNRALAEISDTSTYCKIVQADDCIFPECLQRMIHAFEQSESIGLVSSYYLKGDTVRGSGFPYPTQLLSGKEMARLYLRTGLFVFGSPTAVMYRSSLVRDQKPFYDETLLHEDTEKCMQILMHWNFGFVHQVLSFLRTDNESISSAVRSFQPEVLDWYIIMERYAPIFLGDKEATVLRKGVKRIYYRILAEEAVRFQKLAFWRYHTEGLRTLGQSLDWSYLGLQISLELVRMGVNPGNTVMRSLRFCKRGMRRHLAGLNSSTSLRVNE